MDKELFVEYHSLKKEVNKINDELDDLLNKKARIFGMTQPQASDVTKEMFPSAMSSNDKFLLYTIKTEELDKQITNKKNELGVKKYQMKLKLMDLRESKDILDRIYVYKYVDKKKVGKFYRLTHYSRMQVYRKIQEIEEKIKDVTKCYNS